MRHIISFFLIPHWVLAALLVLCSPAMAIEVAPRIEDREIIERLTRLEEGQKYILQYIDQRFDDVNRRFDDVNNRFDDVNQRITDQQTSTDRQFEAVHLRISDLASTMQTMFLALIALIVALFSYIAWDRRTMFRPLKEKLDLADRRLDQVCADVEQIKSAMRIRPDGLAASGGVADRRSDQDAAGPLNQVGTIPGAVRA